MKTTQIVIAGFGGQGILFSGKFLAYKGLLEDLQVSWLPSYGPDQSNKIMSGVCWNWIKKRNYYQKKLPEYGD